MKKTFIKFSVTVVLILLSYGLFAQNPPHPNGGNAPGSGNTPVGGGAPIDGGLSIMILMGVAYGSKKIFKRNSQENN